MADMHEVIFSWPEVEANTVIVTGTFDQWSSSVYLTKTPRGFEGSVKVPWGERVLYKFLVDGRWVTAQSQPEEPDSSGNVNNVYECPSKPEPSAVQAPSSDLLSETVDPKDNGSEDSAAGPVSLTEQDALGEKVSHAALLVKDAPVTSTNDIASKTTGSALDHAQMTVVAPVPGVTQDFKSDSIGTFERANESVSPALPETRPGSESVEFAADRSLDTIVPVFVPATSVLRHSMTEKALADQAKDSEPPGLGQMLVATTAHPDDSLAMNSLADSTPQKPFQPAAEAISILESSDTRTAPTVNTVSSTVLTALPTEMGEAGLDASLPQAAATAVETDVAIPSVPVVEDMSDVPSKAVVVGRPTAHDIPHEAPSEELASTHPHDKESPVSEISTATDSAVTPTTPTSNGPISEPPPLVPNIEAHPEATNQAPTPDEGAQTKASPPTQGAEPVQTEMNHVEHSPPTAEASLTEASRVTQIPAIVDIQAVGLNPNVTSEAGPATTNTTPSRAIVSAVSAADTANMAPSSPQPVTNGHSITATSTSVKKVASDTDAPLALPTTSSAANSPADTSKSGGTRKKRVSIFGKVKQLFSADKEEKKERKEKK